MDPSVAPALDVEPLLKQIRESFSARVSLRDCWLHLSERQSRVSAASLAKALIHRGFKFQEGVEVKLIDRFGDAEGFMRYGGFIQMVTDPDF